MIIFVPSVIKYRVIHYVSQANYKNYHLLDEDI